MVRSGYRCIGSGVEGQPHSTSAGEAGGASKLRQRSSAASRSKVAARSGSDGPLRLGDTDLGTERVRAGELGLVVYGGVRLVAGMDSVPSGGIGMAYADMAYDSDVTDLMMYVMAAAYVACRPWAPMLVDDAALADMLSVSDREVGESISRLADLGFIEVRPDGVRHIASGYHMWPEALG